ncbi:CRISPR-associated endonuclease Cas2 [uncultured Helicobacter sp.]|uniref:CRISPR-associated endonuclease Cas2 n=1 Tax=uncultured Helicobacter sp. TaxID=175537 RepID=UPI00374F94D9
MVEDKFMRVLVMFDLPTQTKKDRHHSTKFRNNLIKLGFFMIQFSVYMRICKGAASAKSSINNVRKFVPPKGSVRCITITEKQFDAMEILLGGVSFNEEMNAQKNLTLFSFDEKAGDYVYGANRDRADTQNATQEQKEEDKRAVYQGRLFEL